MKIRTLALTALALSAATTFAVASPSEGQPLNLAEVMAHMESRYSGEGGSQRQLRSYGSRGGVAANGSCSPQALVDGRQYRAPRRVYRL